jgi:hypothetical protein
MDESSAEDVAELDALIGRARELYEVLDGIPLRDRERRRDVWSDIVEIQDRITVCPIEVVAEKALEFDDEETRRIAEQLLRELRKIPA